MALILIADHDPLVGDVVRSTLAERGYVVGVVGNGPDALRAVQAKQPDLVILDCSMPGLGGVEVLRRLRLSTFGFQVPVLMLTARSGRDDEEIAFRAGADEYLRKPFDPAELTALVDHMLAKAKSPPSAAING